ncbi:MAG: protein kinase, partial [Candidatus Pacearchaeota archaeon]
CLILRNEPVLGVDYTEESQFRDENGNLVKRRLPKGNTGRIALLNQKKVPYLHMKTTEFSTIFWGDIGDETLLDPVPLAIEERAFELFQEEHKFPELATEKGEREFRLKYIPKAIEDLESKFNSSGMKGYVLRKVSKTDPLTQKTTETEEYIRFQEHCWSYLRYAHRLKKGQKFFPNGAAVRMGLEEPKGLLKLARLRDMAMRRLHREHQVRTVYMGETVGGKPVDIMTYHTPIPWKSIFEHKTLEEILSEVLVATLRELKFCYENFNAIHRDIKPSNLILPVGDVLKILDWGIVRFSAESSTLTRDFALGTPAYMSPEQIRREPLDFRSDICSLGWTMYAILSGKEPLPAVSSPEEAIGLRAFGYTPLAVTHFDRIRSDLERRCKGKGFFERRKEYSRREEMIKNLELVLAWMCQPVKELRPGSYDEIIDAVIDVYNGRQPKTLFEFLEKLEKTIPAYLSSISKTASKEQFNAACHAFAYVWKPRVFLEKVFSQKEQAYVRPADLGEELAKTLNYKAK